MSLTLELLRMETDREPMYWPFNASSTGLISAVPHDCPKAIKKATTNTTADPGALVNNNNNNNNNASTKNSVLNGLSQHKRHSYCKYTFLSCIFLPNPICTYSNCTLMNSCYSVQLFDILQLQYLHMKKCYINEELTTLFHEMPMDVFTDSQSLTIP